MEELQVIVQQQPGVIQWNFEDLKAALQEEMKTYEAMIYDDGAIKTAKQDVAMLRKLRKSVDDRRKEIKTKCLEPYDVIEAQAKELTGLIDRPINMIAGQVRDYEAAQRASRKERILEYMREAFADFPSTIAKKAQFAIYDSHWENATAKESDWKFAIDSESKKIREEIEIIKQSEADDDFREAALKVYASTLSLTEAMGTLQNLHRQQEAILEKERRRREEEKRLEEERVRAVEAKKTEALTQKTEEQRPEPAEQNFQAQATQETVLQDRPVASAKHKAPSATIYLYDASEAQIQKILDYIRFIGVKGELES